MPVFLLGGVQCTGGIQSPFAGPVQPGVQCDAVRIHENRRLVRDQRFRRPCQDHSACFSKDQKTGRQKTEPISDGASGASTDEIEDRLVEVLGGVDGGGRADPDGAFVVGDDVAAVGTLDE